MTVADDVRLFGVLDLHYEPIDFMQYLCCLLSEPTGTAIVKTWCATNVGGAMCRSSS